MLDDIRSLDLDRYDWDELKANGHAQLNANHNNRKKQALIDEVLVYQHPIREHGRFYLDIHDEHMKEQSKQNDDVIMVNLRRKKISLTIYFKEYREKEDVLLVVMFLLISNSSTAVTCDIAYEKEKRRKKTCVCNICSKYIEMIWSR